MRRFIIITLLCIFALPCLSKQQPEIDAQQNLAIQTKGASIWDEAIEPSFLSYTEYFFYNEQIDDFDFKPLSNKMYKLLNKQEKSYYKKMKKVNKYMMYNRYNDAIRLVPDFLPAYYDLSKFAESKKNYNVALYYWKYVYELNQKAEIFNQEYLDWKLTILNYINGNYNDTLTTAYSLRQKYYKQYGINDDYYFLTVIISDCNYNLGRYHTAIKEALKVNKSYKEYNVFISEILYLSYFKTQQKSKSYEITQIVLKNGNELIWLKRAMKSAPNDKLKELYAKKIKSYYKLNHVDTWSINLELGIILDKKIKTACETIQGYYKPPLWEDISKRDGKLMTFAEENKRFEDFYNEISAGIKKYKGENLKAYLTDINNHQKEISQTLLEEQRYREMQLLELQRIRQLQNMNYNMWQSNMIQEEQNRHLRNINNVLNTYR